MTKNQTKTKPKCNRGTACGYTCINGKYQCSDKVLKREADALIKSVVKSNIPKDNTKLMKLDYLNSPITDDHISEFNQVTGMTASKAEIESIVWSAVMYSNGGKWDNQDSVNSEETPGSLAKYLAAPGTKYTGDVYRGETYATEDEAVAAISRYSEGLPYLQSWSKSEDVAKIFGTSTKKPYSVMYKDSSGSMTDIEKFTQAYSNEFVEGWDKSEQEVVSSPGYKATRKTKVTRNGNIFTVEA